MRESDYQEKELFLVVFLFFKRNFLLLFLMGLVGGGLGYVLSKSINSTYSYTSSVCSEIVQSDLIDNSLSILSKMVKNKQYDGVSKALSVPLIQAENIKEVSSSIQESETNKYNKDRRLFGENCVKLVVTLKDTLGFYSTLESIDSYLNESFALKSLQVNNAEGNKELMGYLDRKMAELDSIHKTVIKDPSNLPQFDMGFEDGLQLGVEKQKLNQAMGYTSNAALFMNKENILVKNVRRGLNYSVAGAFSLFFLALMFLLLKELNGLSQTSSEQ